MTAVEKDREPAGFPVTVTDRGLFLPALQLHLDPMGPVPFGFVSHGHSDHTRGALPGGRVFGSPETALFVEARATAPPATPPSIERLAWDGAIERPIPSEFGGGMARLSIAPAGHILGAAQLIVDHPKGRFVYTGDYRSGGGRTHAAGVPLSCDTLLVESTFALPIFRFPDRSVVEAELIAWCRKGLAQGETPVLLAYALGKSQELIACLLEAGLPLVAHGAVYRMSTLYESLGVAQGVADGRLHAYRADASKEQRGAVWVVPPHVHGQPMVRKLRSARVAYVSGWALLDAPLEQRRADAGFPISDHADHDDLVRTIAATGAKEVYVTHGDDAAVFAKLLRTRGCVATPLEAPPVDRDPGVLPERILSERNPDGLA